MMEASGLSDNQQPITIITANIGYTHSAGHHAKAKQAFSELIKNKRPTLVFLQESSFKNIKFQKWKKYEIPSEYYNIHNGDEATFLYDSDQLDLSLVNSADIDKIRRAVTGGNESKLPLKRMPMVSVKPSPNSKLKFDILCVSWHAPQIESDLEKEEILLLLLNVVKKLSDMYVRPFIIGGDFNLPLYGVKEILKSFNEMEVYEYIPTHRRRYRQIDFFIASKPLNLKECKPVPWNTDEMQRIIDHDPIIAKFDIQGKPKIKREEKDKREEEMEKLIKSKIAQYFMEEIEEKCHKTIEECSEDSSEETKNELTKKIVEEFKEKMHEFKNK